MSFCSSLNIKLLHYFVILIFRIPAIQQSRLISPSLSFFQYVTAPNQLNVTVLVYKCHPQVFTPPPLKKKTFENPQTYKAWT